MKNKKSLWLASTALLVGVSFSAATVFADEGGSLNTDGTITFEQGKAPEPVNPVNPVEPITPDNPVGPIGEGLTLDYVSTLDFGTKKISTTTQTYYATADKGKNSKGEEISYPNYVQVSDLRGTKAGWNLSVKQNAQFTAGTDELTGAKLTFSNAELVTGAKEADSYKPTATAGASFTLTPGTELPLINSENGKGMGTWVYRFGDATKQAASIGLEVPGTTLQLAKAYSTTLTWQLNNTPVNK